MYLFNNVIQNYIIVLILKKIYRGTWIVVIVCKNMSTGIIAIIK